MRTIDDAEWVQEAYRRLGSVMAVAREAGVTYRVALLRFHAFGIPMRKPTGRTHNKDGYILVKCKGHPGATRWGYVYEHRLVMQTHLGRTLDSGEHVHHLNGDRADNRVENLVLTTSRRHRCDYHSGPRPGTKRLAEKVLALRASGLLVREIAREVGLCVPVIAKLLARTNIQCHSCSRRFHSLKGLGMHIVRAHRTSRHHKARTKNQRGYSAVKSLDQRLSDRWESITEHLEE